MVDTEALLERFLRYCRIDTQADESSTAVPTTPGQLVLGEILADELRALGLVDVEHTPHGVVYATLPGNVPAAPTVALVAHVDTSPETSGANVRPIVHRAYAGGDIVLPGDLTRVIRPSECPELAALVGQTIVTTDGTTLLGGDDKAGVAVIMQAVATLAARPELPRCPLRVCFTCDEEVGRGTDHLDIGRLNAAVAYTLDGGGVGEVEAETFSADKATVTVTGVNIHPSIGKGRMVNAVRIAAAFVDRLPRRRLSPETTDGREGFVHPYQFAGGVAETTVGLLLRDFDAAELSRQAELLRSIARGLEAEYPDARITIDVKAQYRNMAEGIAREPRAVTLADEAMRRAGLVPRHLAIRGGTDGSQLTAKGVPTPNLSCGEHNIHSPLEWVCLEELATCTRVVVELAGVWSREGVR